jgi:hypothetical protein
MPAGALGPMRVTLPPEQNVVAEAAAIVAVGKLFTVTVVVAVFVQPLTVTVYVIVVVPAVTPLTTPPALIVATEVLLELHVPPVVALDNVVVEPTHTPVLPVIEATVGRGVTVTVVADDVVEHPFKSVTVTV